MDAALVDNEVMEVLPGPVSSGCVGAKERAKILVWHTPEPGLGIIHLSVLSTSLVIQASWASVLPPPHSLNPHPYPLVVTQALKKNFFAS